VTLQRAGDGLTAAVGDKQTTLKPRDLGLEGMDIPLGADGVYRLDFPRAFVHEGAGTVFCRSGIACAGTVDGQPVMLYDDNLDGVYAAGTDAVGLGPCGAISVFAPLGKLLPTTQAVHVIDQVAADGSSISLSPYVGQTGKLKAQAASKDLEVRLAVASEDGQCSVGFLAGDPGAPGLVLPAGKYRILYAHVYRPLLRSTAAVVTPGSGLPITVSAGQDTAVTLGDALLHGPVAAPGAPGLTVTADAMLEVDLSAVEEACEAGDIAKAQKLLGDQVAKYHDGPNYQATKGWFDSLSQRLELEATAEAAALRSAEDKLLALVKKNDLAAAKPQVSQVQAALGALPGKYANLPAYKVHKARVEAMVRYAADRQPGLSVTYFDHTMTRKTGAEVVEKVFWDENPKAGGGHMQFLGARYVGFLVAPAGGEYELSLESDDGARLFLDGQQVIDHWKGHNMSEKSCKVKLTAGPHPIKIEYYQGLGGAGLHFRWTPPGGRKVVVPPWTLESAREDATSVPAGK
jgi:hypothetical protein